MHFGLVDFIRGMSDIEADMKSSYNRTKEYSN